MSNVSYLWKSHDTYVAFPLIDNIMALYAIARQGFVVYYVACIKCIIIYVK